MKKSLNGLLFLILLVLVAANAYIFVSDFKMSEEIGRLEAQTRVLHQENMDLETKAQKLGSLDHTASAAAALGFTSNAKTYYLHSLGFAKRN